MAYSIHAPENLSSSHYISDFNSGEPILDEWLRRRALQNQEAGASRTYVTSIENKVIGFYSLAAGGLTHQHAPTSIKRNMPNPIPVIILGRLAVDISYQGRPIGAFLLKDAIFRTLQVSEIAGIRALLVHAISENAKQFYKKYGFQESPLDSLTLMLKLSEVRQNL
ncbi:MAG: GNAT family N-acetyltransferase [Parachlamydiaceae bacterium]